jgi:glutamate---cysteine ligase / carboxylate-amine ligase
VAKLHKLLYHNTTFRVYRRRLIDENRWRASRYGLDGRMIDFGREAEVDTRKLLGELLDFIATEVDELGSGAEIAHVEKIMREGTGADRQIAAWASQHNMHDVVDLIVNETYEGLTVPQGSAATEVQA